MRCYKCGATLNRSDRCPECGTNIAYYRKIAYLSNYHYNEGLRKARIRDLSGARESLIRSLKYNKRNVRARNLLGLVHYELGHVGEALSEWIVSSNIQPEENIAASYVQQMQKETEELETLGEQIKSYNQCLKYFKSGNKDLAILHLKKVLAGEPRLVEPYQLMGLVCIKAGQYENAARYLKTAYRMDHGDVTTLEYMTELQIWSNKEDTVIDNVIQPREVKGRRKEKHAISYTLGNETIIQPKVSGMIDRLDFKKINPFRVSTGLLLAAAVVWFLIIPARVQSSYAKMNETTRSYNNELDDLNEQIDLLTTQLEETKAREEEALKASQSLSGNQNAYDILLTLQRQYLNGNYDDAEMAMQLIEIDKEALTETARQTYDNLYDACYYGAIDDLYTKGHNNWEWEQYQTAAGYFEQVIKLKEDYPDCGALYYMGRCYQELDAKAKARKAFTTIIKNYPDSGYAQAAIEADQELNLAGTPAAGNQDEDWDD